MNKIYEWAIIGAGPAGIAALGQLLDMGIDENKILWVDPEFKVGDFGKYWKEVSSNTTVKLFIDYLNKCKSFNYSDRKSEFKLDTLPLDETCKLSLMVEPLLFVTAQLKTRIDFCENYVEKINLYNRLWNLTLKNQEIIQSKNVILATGAIPKSMQSPEGVKNIDIYTALDIFKLDKTVNKNDKVAVSGSSHSAVILLKELLELGVSEVINFYREPLRFAVPLGDWILFDDTGLKGNTAIWARENLNGILPKRLKRIISNNENVDQILPTCTKVIYAIGFYQRSPIISEYPNHKYNPYNGIIAPGLFGVGIGFPESKTDRYGNTEFRVGLWKFINYLDSVMPLWLKYST